jgi:hypothetical protein
MLFFGSMAAQARMQPGVLAALRRAARLLPGTTAEAVIVPATDRSS